jgi:hypothetical protein
LLAVTAAVFLASPRRNGHGLIRQGRLAPAVQHDCPRSSRRNAHPGWSRRHLPQDDGRKRRRRLHGAWPSFAGKPRADSGLIAVLIDIRELGDRSSYMDAGILCILGSALWIVSTPNLWCGHS